MKTLDLNKQKRAAENLGRGSNTSKFYLSKEMGESIDIRIIPPRENVGETAWVEVPTWWIDKKPYISPEVFDGGVDVIQNAIDAIKDEFANNKKMLANIEKLLSNQDNIKKSYEQLVVGCVFAFKRDKNDEIKDIWVEDITREEAQDIRKYLTKNPKATMKDALEQIVGLVVEDTSNIGRYEPVDFSKLKKAIVDEELKIISLGQKALKAVVATWSQKLVLKAVGDAPLGALDQYVGFNTTVYKTGKNRNTVYTASHDEFPMELPDWMFKDENKPDIIGMLKKQLKSDSYYVSVLRNYLFGEDIVEDEDDSKPRRSRVQDDDEDDAPQPTRRKPVIQEDDEVPVRRRIPMQEDEDVPVRRRPVTQEQDDAPQPIRRKVVIEEVVESRQVVKQPEDDAPQPTRRLAKEDHPVKEVKVSTPAKEVEPNLDEDFAELDNL